MGYRQKQQQPLLDNTWLVHSFSTINAAIVFYYLKRHALELFFLFIHFWFIFNVYSLLLFSFRFHSLGRTGPLPPAFKTGFLVRTQSSKSIVVNTFCYLTIGWISLFVGYLQISWLSKSIIILLFVIRSFITLLNIFDSIFIFPFVSAR